MYQGDPSLHIVPPSEGLHIYKADTRPRGWRSTPATPRQQSVLDRLAREIAMLPVQPSPALKDLYRSIGLQGVKDCEEYIEEARQSAGKASSLIAAFLDRSTTYAVRFMLRGTCSMGNNGEPCRQVECLRCDVREE